MKVRSGTLAALLLSLGILQGCAPKYDDQIVLEVGQNKVTMRDYENFYLRNSSTLEAARKSSQAEREHFLDLLTNYKLKLQDAYDRHLLDDPEIMNELREYRATLASTFLIEKDITSPGIRRLYDRRQKQVHVQQILLAMKPDASPADTLRIYTKATDIIRRAKAGESFDTLAVKYSEAPGVNTSRGDYYFITGGKLVAPFEDAIYSIQPGQIGSNPVRTPFGYHAVRVLEAEPTRSLKARHIMARFQTTNPDSAEVAGALTRIKGIQDSLKRGWDFANLAMKLSEDGGSSGQGGDLGWFERARWVLPFDEAAFKLKQGQTSGIVRTPFGFHLIRCDSVRSLGSYAAMESELKKNYQQTRYNDDYTSYVDSLKRQYAYSFHEDAFKELLSHVDSTKTTDDSAWDKNLTPEFRTAALMTISGRSIPADTVIKILRNKPEFRSASLREGELRPHVDRIADAFLFEEKAIGLESRYPEFAALMNEYTDGIILYKLEQTEVWNQTSVNDSSLRKYFAENGDKFMFPERLRIGEIYLGADTTALMIYDSLKHGADFNSLAMQWNEDSDLKAKSTEKGFVIPDTGEVAKQASALAIGEISEPFELENGGYAIVKLIAKEPARPKTYEEAGAEVSNSYQEHQSKLLEQQWVDRVRQKFAVKQNKELLRNAFTSPQASGPP